MATTGIFSLLAVLLAGVLAVMIIIYLIVPLLKGMGWLIGRFFWLIGAIVQHFFQFIAGMLRDSLRAVGAVPAGVIFALLSVANVVIGRWSAAAHFGNNVQREAKVMAACIYRVALGHPLRFILLGSLLEGIEQRVPAAVAQSPGSDRPTRRTGTFEGYTIVGSLPGGGSGAKLYIAEPTPQKRERIIRSMGSCPDRVVIKSFAIAEGSSLPQIVRESRALECAKRIGLVLEHDLTSERFFYIMGYVPGENLGAVVRQYHAQSGDAGLADREMRAVLGQLSDVVSTLAVYHDGGLWHKDIKPDNIIIHNNRAHIVDLGLVTPLRSAMTLTTHGTEYFRDPEMVRMALRGVKVHEVDGAKFDIYAAGAVLFYAVENTFPAHGGLSVISKRCPEVVKWIARRAMAEYNQRYDSAGAMLADIEAVRNSPDMLTMRPADLPSMHGVPAAVEAASVQDAHFAAGIAPAGAPARPADPAPAVADAIGEGFAPSAGVAPGAAAAGGAGDEQWGQRMRPKLRMVNWWTGGYRRDDAGSAGLGGRSSAGGGTDRRQWRADLQRAKSDLKAAVSSAVDDVKHAVERVRSDVGANRAQGSRGESVSVVMNADQMDGPRHRSPRPPAAEQVANAQKRAAGLRERARQHARDRHKGRHAPGERVTAGVVVSAVLIVGLLLAGAGLFLLATARMHVGRASVAVGRQTAGAGGGNSLTVIESWTEDGQIIKKQINPEVGIIAIGPKAGRSAQLSPEIQRLLAVTRQATANLARGFVIVNDHPDPRSAAIKAQEDEAVDWLEDLGLERLSDAGYEPLIRTRAGQFISGPYAIEPGETLDKAEQAVSDLLEHDLASVGCILWLYRSLRDADAVDYWVITPDSVESTVDDKILSYLMMRRN